MTGRALMIGLLAFTALFGVALWWFQTRAFYEEIEAGTVTVQGASYPVSEWQGIDAATSPLKLRACFRLGAEARAAIARLEPYDEATPLTAPGWFDCFDAATLTTDIRAGRATPYLAAEEEFDGANRILALYDDGRAFMWRQLTPEFANQ